MVTYPVLYPSILVLGLSTLERILIHPVSGCMREMPMEAGVTSILLSCQMCELRKRERPRFCAKRGGNVVLTSTIECYSARTRPSRGAIYNLKMIDTIFGYSVS